MPYLVIKRRNLSIILIALTIFINGLGTVISFEGINIVYPISILAIGSIVLECILNSGKAGRFIESGKWIIITVFLFWILYGGIQHFIIKDNDLYSIGYTQLITNFLIVLFVLYIFDPYDKCSIEPIVNAFLLVLFVNTFLGTIEWTLGIHFTEASSIWDANSVRVFSENVNEYATTMYCALFGILLHKRIKGNTKFFVLLGIGALICIVKSTSRGIILAVLVYLILYVLMKWTLNHFKHFQIIIKLLIFVSILILIIAITTGELSSIVDGWISKYSGAGNTLSDAYRWYLITQGMQLFFKSNWLGVGSGQSIYYLNMNIHNFFIEILAEYGVIIFILIVGIFVYIWMGVFDSNLDNDNRAMFFAIIPSMVVASISSSSINKFKLFWIIIVILYMMRKSSKSNYRENGK